MVFYLGIWGAAFYILFSNLKIQINGYRVFSILIGSALIGYFVQNLFLFDTPGTIGQFIILMSFVIWIEISKGSDIELDDNLNGKPIAQLLLKENCTVTITHSKTKNLKEECLKADILIAAVGVANLVKKDWVKSGSVIIDVGINKQGDKIVGDVNFEEVKDKVKAITPVPGGVGPMTIACLLKNTLECFKARLT